MRAGDQNNSLLSEVDKDGVNRVAHTAYGHASAEQPIKSRLRFNGEFSEPQTGWQLLGNGYRAYSAILRRFLGADSESPFGAGWLNPYAYCEGEPVLNTDPDGHFSVFGWLKSFVRPPSYSGPRSFQRETHRSDVASVSGGPARSRTGLDDLMMYGKKGRTSVNPLFDASSNSSNSSSSSSSSSSISPTSTVTNAFDFLDDYGSASPVSSGSTSTASIVNIGAGSQVDISRRPRYPLPHEKPQKRKTQSLIKESSKTMRQLAEEQARVRNQEWLKRQERKERSKDKFNL